VTDEELLAATGSIWQVKIYADGNRRRVLRTITVRAELQMDAQNAARRYSPGARVYDATPWDPRRERWGAGIECVVRERAVEAGGE
jgi:hypothetical protein